MRSVLVWGWADTNWESRRIWQVGRLPEPQAIFVVSEPQIVLVSTPLLHILQYLNYIILIFPCDTILLFMLLLQIYLLFEIFTYVCTIIILTPTPLQEPPRIPQSRPLPNFMLFLHWISQYCPHLHSCRISTCLFVHSYRLCTWATSLKRKSDFFYPWAPELPKLLTQLWDYSSSSPVCAELLTGFILCRSCAGTKGFLISWIRWICLV